MEPRLKNEIVLTIGDTVTYAELAEILEKVAGKKLKRELWTEEDRKERLRKDPNDLMEKWCLTFARGKGVAWDEDLMNR